MTGLSRRHFLLSSAALGAGLAIGWGAAANPGPADLAAWVRITPDNRILLYTSVQEMGQGAWCSHARIVADELDVPWDVVEVVQAPIEADYAIWAPEHTTGGSGSVRNLFTPLRRAGAAARSMLVAAAAQRWQVPANACAAEQGRVVHSVSGRALSYGELAEAAARLPVPQDPPLKTPAEWRLIGNDAARRKDIPAKLDGSTVYAVDVQLPDMLTATILQAPVFGARLRTVDTAPALAVRGVRHVLPMRGITISPPGDAPITLPDAVAVVADGFWAARKGLEALSPEWELPADKASNTTDALYFSLRTAAEQSEQMIIPGNPQGDARKQAETQNKAAVAAALGRASRVIYAEYRLPLLAHAQMEPMSAVARVTDGRAELWAGMQSATISRRYIGAMLGIKPDNVEVHTLFSGGGFGRRYKQDYTSQAAWLSAQCGNPVKLVWTREEDMRQGWYRAASVSRLQGGLDASGRATGIRVQMATLNDDYGGSILSGGEGTRALYDLDALGISSVKVDSTVPCGPWRSVPNTVSAFAFESFIDELAHAAKADPLDFRLSMLSKEPRARRVLELAAHKVGWGMPLASGRGRGVALWQSFDSYVAQTVEVAVEGSALRIAKVCCAIDCGTAVHPDGIRAQGEGSIVMALTAALFGEINLESGRVVESNYDNYPMLLLAQTPPIDIAIVETPDAPRLGGVGEPMTPPLAPALANAIFAATGQRIRSLPLSGHGLTLA